jgi:hypothetical protein
MGKLGQIRAHRQRAGSGVRGMTKPHKHELATWRFMFVYTGRSGMKDDDRIKMNQWRNNQPAQSSELGEILRRFV